MLLPLFLLSLQCLAINTHTYTEYQAAIKQVVRSKSNVVIIFNLEQ